MTGLNNIRVITVRWRASILSLGSGGGIPALVGQKRCVPKMAESIIQYNTMAIMKESCLIKIESKYSYANNCQRAQSD